MRDGASAQYGSDAIAGVINFVLDDISEGGTLSYKMGEYTEGDGNTTTIAGKYGMPLGQDGFVTTSFRSDKPMTHPEVYKGLTVQL